MPTVVVVTDANVLINFCLINQISLLGALPDLIFVVPQEVLNELTDPLQRKLVDTEIEVGRLKTAVLDSTEALELYAQLRGLMGQGEAACLAIATAQGAHIASDEKKRFRRKAIELIGEDRILRTEDFLLKAVLGELITVADADAFKGVLERNRYLMPFASFLTCSHRRSDGVSDRLGGLAEMGEYEAAQPRTRAGSGRRTWNPSR